MHQWNSFESCQQSGHENVYVKTFNFMPRYRKRGFDCMANSTSSKPGKRCRSQAGGNAVSPSGDAQQASATRATMTTVAVMGSMGFSWVAFNLPDPTERPCDQLHSTG